MKRINCFCVSLLLFIDLKALEAANPIWPPRMDQPGVLSFILLIISLGAADEAETMAALGLRDWMCEHRRIMWDAEVW